MLRPATPLSVLLFVAFALLLLAVLSTPIIPAIPLGSFKGVNFGVFGYCQESGCTPIEIGYDTSELFKGQKQAFDLPDSTRNTLSALLIVHPVAAFLTLVMFILAAVAHLHSASHSARYLLAVFIFSFINFLVCLMSFLIDVLLFVPHMAWGSYIVLAATILVGISGLVSCAMRRTLVGRKARKKRIAENAEMSGENYFSREAQAKAAASSVPMQPTVPLVSGGNGAGDNLPVFASFESQKKDDQVSDERVPLTARSPTQRSPNNVSSDLVSGETTAYNASTRSGSVPPGPTQRDQYGNIVPVAQDAYGVRRGPSFERMNSRGRGAMPPGGYRGGRGGYARGGYNGYGPPPPGNARAGYGPPGRGGYPPTGRGGYGPPPRGGFSGGSMRGGRPPPGYQNGAGQYDRRGSPANAYAGPYGRRSSDVTPGYSTNTSTNPSMPSVSTASYEAYNPDRGSLPRAESPPPLPDDASQVRGQALEMDATSSPAHPPQGFGAQYGPIRDSDADIAGMIGMQQGRTQAAQRHDTYMSEGSKYSTDQDQYVPPRQAWQDGQGRNSPRMPSPLTVPQRPVELPGRNTPPAGAQGDNGYYEDVDPRFADSTARAAQSSPLGPLPASNSYEDIHNGAGARSPGAESDRSNFTSISQRGVNPRWNPPPPMPGYGQVPRRPVQQQRQDVLLNSNPDFELSGNRVGSPPRGGPGMIPGSAYPTGPL